MKNKTSNIWDEKLALKTARILIANKAYLVDFNKKLSEWITWNNGIKCPVYLNCRYIYGKENAFCMIVPYLAKMLKNSPLDFDLFVGLSTAGIPLAAAMSLRLNKPFAYVRTSKKEHGVGGLVEGDPQKGIKAIILDDTLASGGSVIRAIESLENEFSIKTIGVVTVASMSEFGFENKWDELKRRNIDIMSLTNYQALQAVAVKEKLMTQQQSNQLSQFYQSPSKYVW